MTDLVVEAGTDGLPRCWWGVGSADYEVYHDTEWGFAQGDDIRLFEKVCLEGFQSGLSWLTILRKRENFRAAFDGFDFEVVAGYSSAEIDRLLRDAGIVRHRGKIEATINNAREACDLVEECGSLAAYFWSYEPDRPEPPTELVATTDVSVAMAKDLKRRGWRFVGPTTSYAFMQAMGLVNDHLDGCVTRDHALARRAQFIPPVPRSLPAGPVIGHGH